MNKQERLENTIAGNLVDRTPAAIWRHFPGDDQRSADFAASVVAYQQRYDWDYVTLTPPSTFTAVDYGAQSDWTGSPTGDRHIVRPVVTRSLEWTELRTLDPARGEVGKLLEVLRLLERDLAPETPVQMTIYSPLAQARRLSGDALLYRNMRTHADRLQSGLNIITTNTLRLIEALKRTHIAGIHYVTEHADYDRISEAEYLSFGVPYDQKILSELAPAWWLNTLRIDAEAPMFTLVKDYPVQAVTWQAGVKPGLPEGKSMIIGAVCGGLVRRSDLHDQTPGVLRNTVRDAIQATNGRRLIVSADGPVPVTTPYSHLRAVRAAVEPSKGASI